MPSTPSQTEGTLDQEPPACPAPARIPRRAVWIRLIHASLFTFSVAAAWGLSLALSAGVSSERVLEPSAFLAFLAALVGAKSVAFELFRLHRASWRWFGLPDAAVITVANTSGSVFAALALGSRIATIAIAALLVIEWLVSQGLLLGSRMLYRVLLEATRKGTNPPSRKRVLIYGAGRRGMNLLRQIGDNPAAPYEIAGFIDDDGGKRHQMMRMTPVLGNGDELPRLARLHQVQEVLVAVGCPTAGERRRIRELAAFAGLPVRFPKRQVRRSQPRRPAKPRQASRPPGARPRPSDGSPVASRRAPDRS